MRKQTVKLNPTAKWALIGVMGLLIIAGVLVWYASQPIVDDETWEQVSSQLKRDETSRIRPNVLPHRDKSDSVVAPSFDAASHSDSEESLKGEPFETEEWWTPLLETGSAQPTEVEANHEPEEPEEEETSFGLTPEQIEQQVATISQEIDDFAEEYRGLQWEADELVKGPQTPEVLKRRGEIRERKLLLYRNLIVRAGHYLLLTKDADPIYPGGWIAETVQGIVRLEVDTAPDGRPMVRGKPWY